MQNKIDNWIVTTANKTAYTVMELATIVSSVKDSGAKPKDFINFVNQSDSLDLYYLSMAFLVKN